MIIEMPGGVCFLRSLFQRVHNVTLPMRLGSFVCILADGPSSARLAHLEKEFNGSRLHAIGSLELKEYIYNGSSPLSPLSCIKANLPINDQRSLFLKTRGYSAPVGLAGYLDHWLRHISFVILDGVNGAHHRIQGLFAGILI